MVRSLLFVLLQRRRCSGRPTSAVPSRIWTDAGRRLLRSCTGMRSPSSTLPNSCIRSAAPERDRQLGPARVVHVRRRNALRRTRSSYLFRPVGRHSPRTTRWPVSSSSFSVYSSLKRGQDAGEYSAYQRSQTVRKEGLTRGTGAVTTSGNRNSLKSCLNCSACGMATLSTPASLLRRQAPSHTLGASASRSGCTWKESLEGSGEAIPVSRRSRLDGQSRILLRSDVS